MHHHDTFDSSFHHSLYLYSLIYLFSQARNISPLANESSDDFQLRMEEIWISIQGPGNT